MSLRSAAAVTETGPDRPWFEKGQPVQSEMEDYAQRVGAEFEVRRQESWTYQLPEGWAERVKLACLNRELP